MFAVGLIVLLIFFIFVMDVSQKKDAIRRKYPVIGRFRYLFTRLGEFFRQYFFAMDREELPFNRAERDWVYRSSIGADNTVAFGSTRSLTPVGTVIFVNCPFPTLEEHALNAPEITAGPYTKYPYRFSSIINISAMSFGALSAPAVRALSKGAAMAGCWLNTGEGGLAPYHLEGGCDLIFQIGTAKYGVRIPDGQLDEGLPSRDRKPSQRKDVRIEAQPGRKARQGRHPASRQGDARNRKIRGIPVHTDSISPNRHPEIDSVPDLLDQIARIRDVAEKPTGFKAVLGAWLA